LNISNQENNKNTLLKKANSDFINLNDKESKNITATGNGVAAA